MTIAFPLTKQSFEFKLQLKIKVIEKMKKLLLTTTFALLCTTAFPLSQQEIIENYGADHLYEYEGLKFTFVVERGGEEVARRAWEWNPLSNEVTLKTKTDDGWSEVSYDRDEIENATEEIIAADKKFINDSFWFAWPIHLMWSDENLITERGDKFAMLRGEWLDCSSIMYGDEGGYTPGDRYDLFFEESGLSVEWIFVKGGQNEPTLNTTMEDHHQLGELIVSTVHHNQDKTFKLSFEDIQYKKPGSTEWQNSKPLE